MLFRSEVVLSRLAHLTPAEARVFLRVIPVFLPVDAAALVPLDRVPVVESIDAQVGRLPRAARALLSQALGAFDHAAIPLGGGLTRAVNLDDAALHDWLVDWSRGNELFRAGFGAIKQLVALGYFGSPPAWPPLEYDGPVTDPKGIPRLGHQPLPEV